MYSTHVSWLPIITDIILGVRDEAVSKMESFPYSAYVICHSYKVLCGNDLCLPVHRLSAYYLSPAHHHYAPITLDSFLLSKHSRLSATLSPSLVFLSIYNVFLSHFQSLLKCQLLRRSSLILHYHSILFFSNIWSLSSVNLLQFECIYLFISPH